MKKSNLLALRALLFYCFIAVFIWILFADRVLAFLVTNPAWLARVQTCKGLAFVAVTAVLFYFLLRNQLRRLENKIPGREQEELRRSEKQKAKLINNVDGIVWEADARTFQFTFVSQQAERLLDYPVSQWTGEKTFWQDHLHPDDRERAVEFCLEQTRRGMAHDFEYRMLAADGRVVWLRDIVAVEMESGQPIVLRGVMVDVTERKQEEDELRWKTALLEAQVDSAIDGILVVDSQGNKILQNERLNELWKLPPRIAEKKEDAEQLQFAANQTRNSDEFIKKVAYLYAHPDEVSRDELELIDGTILDRYSSPIRDKAGKYYGRIWTFRDITERRKSEARLEEAQRITHAGHWERDLIADRVTWSDETYRIFGLQPQEHILNLAGVQGMIHPDDRPIQARAVAEAIQGGRPYDVEYRIVRPDGEIRFVHSRGSMILDESGQPLRQFGTVQDITERRQAEIALRASEERFQQLAANINEVFWMVDPVKGNVIYISPAYERIWGRSCQSLYDAPESWLTAIHPEDRERVRLAVATFNSKGVFEEEYRVLRPDLQVRWIQGTAFPVRNAASQIERVVGVARDITDRRQMAEQLRQSQKMDAIGQLAGGVAHDFNNILAAMMMQSELLRTAGNISQEVRDGLQQIFNAAERAANLTRQLLLFSRRQVMQVRDLDLNEVVTSLAKMLQRIIGEDVHLDLQLHATPLMTHADAGMIDQVLMNLAINARDAMSKGGRLLIETTEKDVDEDLARLNPDTAPGWYVCVSVSDTGAGIPPEILPKIFEPFFTTKESGKGTGLGLATVFGIVKQHGGFIQVESEPHCGAIFRIFLPANKVEPKSPTPPAMKARLHEGTETILLVEDDEGVRTLIRVTLERHGYRVLEAANGIEAIKLWDQHSKEVALLLTDLVMPAGVSGHELADRLQKDKPQLNVIFTSGYSAEVAVRQIKSQADENFLQKPFPPDQLLETVRRCLDS